MLREAIVSLTTFVEDKYVPYFNYYWSLCVIIARPVILAILAITTLIQIGIVCHTCLRRKNIKQYRLITVFMVAGLFLAGIMILWAVYISWHTQIIALIMMTAYLALIIYQNKCAKTSVAGGEPDKKCCRCCQWIPILILIGYAFVLFVGWLFFVE